MTLGAAMLGISATGVFGYAAALTYSGTSTANAADQQSRSGVQSGTPPYVNSNNGTTSGGASSNSGGTTIVPGTGYQQPVTPPVTTRHSQHAVSGGS